MSNAKQLGLASGAFGVLAALAWFRGHAAAMEAARRYGFNVDSGVWEMIAATSYLGPLALLFGLCAIASRRGWRAERPLRLGTVGLAVVPWVVLTLIVLAASLLAGVPRML